MLIFIEHSSEQTAEHTFFSSAHRIFTKVDNILSHKINYDEFKTIKVIQSMFSDHSDIKLKRNTVGLFSIMNVVRLSLRLNTFGANDEI